MTEKEKRDLGILYDANYDKHLLNEMRIIKAKCQKYNNIKIDNINKRTKVIKTILGSTKNNLTIMPPFWCDYGYNIHVGENFYSNHNLIILDGAKVSFGDNVFIGPNCGFYTAGHPLDYLRRNEGLEYAKPITIGNNVWFGGGVLVLPGVTIGDNTVIGAGSVVTKDIPSNSLAYGNPCRVIRKITKEDFNKNYNE